MAFDAHPRHREILEILIADYIATAQPVGSCAISRRHPGHVSPATIRNVMADLTEMGLLTQPHVSAGRVPTAQGMKLYVESLFKRRELTLPEMEAIKTRCQGDERRIDAVLSRASHALAAVSHYAGLVVMPDAGRIVFKRIDFIPLSRRRILGIFVSQDGVVQNRLIEVQDELTSLELERAANYCNRSFAGLSIEEAIEKAERELGAERADYDRLLHRAMMLSREVMGDVPHGDLVVEGAFQLLTEPEFADAEEFRRVLAVIEEKQGILHLLTRCREGDGVRIFVGADAEAVGVESVGVVGAPYLRDGKAVGYLGVIGPMRMDYSRVVPIVDFTAKVVSDILES
jgi:heat-inducible transcriptional repressor